MADQYYRNTSELDFVESKGYLGWRYRDVSTRPGHSNEGLGPQEIMALVVRDDRELLDGLVEEHGPFLDGGSALACHAISREFAMIKGGSWQSPVDGQKRRARLGLNFLRRGVMLSFAGEDAVDELLKALPLLKPPTPSQDNEIPRHVQAAFSVLNRMIDLASDLYSGDELARRRLLGQGRPELISLGDGDYDYLCPGISNVYGGLATLDLPFMVLPPGARIQSFVGKLQASGHFRDREEDAARRRVIEDLWGYFGSPRCTLYRGVFQPTEDGNGYVVIAIGQGTRGEHAVAISPWKGEHATFVVRGDCGTGEPWQTVLGRTKTEAKNSGAKRLVFTGSSDGGLDQYEAMKRKIICLLACTPHEFEYGHFSFDQRQGRYQRRVRGSRVSSSAGATSIVAAVSPAVVSRPRRVLPGATQMPPRPASASRKHRVPQTTQFASPSSVPAAPYPARESTAPPAGTPSLWQRFLQWLRAI